MSDSFKIEDNYRKKKISNKTGNRKKTRLIPIISCGIILIFLITAIVIYIKYSINKVNVVKKDSNESYVYTALTEINPGEDEDDYDEIPAFNLVGSEYDKINAAIVENYKSVSSKEDYDYVYKTNVSGNTLSLLISYAYFDGNDVNRYFESIVVDLNKNKILTKTDILKRFKVNEKQINTYLESKFRSIYTDIIKHGYYTSRECDYTCFLNNRRITNNYIDGVVYTIEDNSLIAYKYFDFKSDYAEQDYFLESDYRFIIKK